MTPICFCCKEETKWTIHVCGSCQAKLMIPMKYIRAAIYEMTVHDVKQGEQSLAYAHGRLQQVPWEKILAAATAICDADKSAMGNEEVRLAHNRIAKLASYIKDKKCPVCEGSGQRDDEHNGQKRPCVACGGTGEIQIKKKQ